MIIFSKTKTYIYAVKPKQRSFALLGAITCPGQMFIQNGKVQQEGSWKQKSEHIIQKLVICQDKGKTW